MLSLRLYYVSLDEARSGRAMVSERMYAVNLLLKEDLKELQKKNVLKIRKRKEGMNVCG